MKWLSKQRETHKNIQSNFCIAISDFLRRSSVNLISVFYFFQLLYNYLSFIFTGAQYSVTLSTRASAKVRSTFARQPQHVPAILAMMLLRVIILLFTLSRCCLKVEILSDFTPGYLSVFSGSIFLPFVSMFSTLYWSPGCLSTKWL